MARRRSVPPPEPEPPPAALPPPAPERAGNIHPALAHLAVPAAELVLDAGNVRVHGDENLLAIRQSLERFGQDVPLVVQLQGMVVRKGNGRLIAARQLGWTHVAAIVVDESDIDATLRSLADNRTSELGAWDEDGLKQLFQNLKQEGVDWSSFIGWTEAEQAGLTDAKMKKELELRQEYSVLIRCAGDEEQRIILEELSRHGLNTRALIVDFPVKEPKRPKAGPKLKDGEIEIVRSSQVERTARVMQLEGMFDIPPGHREERWRLEIALDRPWEIGLIVGPSGSGKTTVARELFGESIVASWPWSARAVVDDFPAGMPIVEITAILSSVGFSSPPSWLKPFAALSNGEQFRVMLARTLAEQPSLALVDEFTSVVDRTVARIGSAALSKALRGSGRQFIAVACHYDIEEWLNPDWKIEMPSGVLTWRSLRRRPEIALHIRRAQSSEWAFFSRHHYLSHTLHKAAACFVADVDGKPAAFTAALHRPSPKGGYWSEHRTVCHPDFQGVGIGNATSAYVASLFACKGKGYRSVTTHPAMIRHRCRSPLWRCTRAPSLAGMVSGTTTGTNGSASVYRMSASFEYVGPSNEEDAASFGII